MKWRFAKVSTTGFIASPARAVRYLIFVPTNAVGWDSPKALTTLKDMAMLIACKAWLRFIATFVMFGLSVYTLLWLDYALR